MIEIVQALFWVTAIGSLSTIVVRKRIYPNKLRWRHVAAIGNNPFAKVSIIAPLVAPFVLYTNKLAEFINSHFDLNVSANGLPWLYFSLISLSVAQFTYNLRAPITIKEYSTRNDYVANGGADLGESDWKGVSAMLANRLLAQHGKSPFAISSVKELEGAVRRNRLVEQNFLDPARTALGHYWKTGKLLSAHNEYLQKTINQYEKILWADDFPDNKKHELKELLSLSDTQYRDAHLIEKCRKKLRTLLYDSENADSRISLYLVSVMYLGGFSYFLWHIPNNFIKNLVSVVMAIFT